MPSKKSPSTRRESTKTEVGKKAAQKSAAKPAEKVAPETAAAKPSRKARAISKKPPVAKKPRSTRRITAKAIVRKKAAVQKRASRPPRKVTPAASAKLTAISPKPPVAKKARGAKRASSKAQVRAEAAVQKRATRRVAPTTTPATPAAKAAAIPVKPPVVKPIPIFGPPPPITQIPQIDLQNGIVEILRPDDLLSLWLEFRNLQLDRSNPKSPKLVPVLSKGVAKTGFIIVSFAPQSILEQAYFETGNVTTNPAFDAGAPALPPGTDPLPAPGSVPAYISNFSRLVFRVPASIKEIPYKVASLLDWSQLELVVSPLATGKELPPPITAPGTLQTAIELPWRVVLSPGNGVGWSHSITPETFAGRTALWHTRLSKIRTVKSGATTKRVFEEASSTNTIPLRAIWSPDFVDHGVIPSLTDEFPFQASPSAHVSLSAHDRMQLVILTAGTLGYALGDTDPWVPRPIKASRLFLSSLGGWLSSKGDWPTPVNYKDTAGVTQTLDLTEWVHLATLARDHYVKVVYAGYLYPFGHAASLIKVTERKFVPPGGAVTETTAYLRQHMYIVVREPEKNYGAEPFQHAKREMPFWQSVRIKTIVTPDINSPTLLPPGAPDHSSFWIDVGGANFNFHLSATDLAGNSIDFLTPLIFVSLDEEDLEGVQSTYATSGAQRLCSVKGQKIAYADPSAGDTTLKTTGLYFTSEIILKNQPYTVAPFLPTLDQATVSVPAVEEILGISSPLTISLYQPYLESGLDSNAGVYADVKGIPGAGGTFTQLSLTFPAAQSGGLSTPNITLTALSARKGLVAGKASDAAAGVITPADFFSDLDAQLFGTVPLMDLIPVNTQNQAPAAQNAPEIRTVLTPNHKNPTATVTRIKWSPQLKDYSQPPVKVTFNQNGTSALNLNTTLTRSLNGGPPKSQVTGKLTNFQLNLLGVVALTINSLKFTSNNGQKTIVKAALPNNSPIKFIGPLSFVQTLATILPPGIFGGSGPSIDLGPSEITVSYTLGLPPVSIGVFSLENISITTGLDLPYLNGQPGFEFAFAKRSSPFLLTVECLGGGGFVHLIVTADGVQMVEGSLEFGGEFSFDVGIASGGVHVMAGIYFQLSGTSSDLTGFIDIGGEVSVLGIISISIDLNISLSYQTSNNKSMVEGRATLSISIHIIFFSVSASVSVEKSFGSQPGDPRVDQVLNAQDWSEYAAAFA